MTDPTLINTNNVNDAIGMGYDEPCDPNHDGDGLIVTGRLAGLNVPPRMKLVGPDGEIELIGRDAISALRDAINIIIGKSS